MIRNKYTFISFFILSAQSLNASSVIEKNIHLNNNEINKEQENYDDNNFDFVKSKLFYSVSDLHNKIINEGKKKEFIDPVIKSFSALSQFLLDQKDKFKCSDNITKLANFITNKIVEPYKKEEEAEIISAFICNMSADLNAFSENLYTLQNESNNNSFFNFLCDLLNKKEIDGIFIDVDLSMGNRPHFTINIDKKKKDKDILRDICLKVLKNKNSEAVECTRWIGGEIKINENDNTFFSLLGKNKNKNSFAVCFPKDLNPSDLNVVVYNKKGEEITFNNF